MIEAKIIADSLHPNGKDRITTMLLTFPRIILAEFNTHRVFSRNSASSRAIPFKKMIKSILENPFVPLAFQKQHSGMQGNEYLNPNKKYTINDFVIALNKLFDTLEDAELHKKFIKVLDKYKLHEYTLKQWWLLSRDLATEAAVMLSMFGTTKQLCNRLLEPFMYHQVLVTATEWKNFFALRCPQYEYDNKIFKSKKDCIKYRNKTENTDFKVSDWDDLFWLSINKGQSEIHMMALAECMWDSYNESIPKQLEDGQWHIPLGDNILISWKENSNLESNTIDTIKIATARCARVSYTVIKQDKNGVDFDYESDLKLHDKLLESKHFSPFEHCVRVMDNHEYYGHHLAQGNGDPLDPNGKDIYGICRNFKGFIQYRHIIENN